MSQLSHERLRRRQDLVDYSAPSAQLRGVRRGRIRSPDRPQVAVVVGVGDVASREGDEGQGDDDLGRGVPDGGWGCWLTVRTPASSPARVENGSKPNGTSRRGLHQAGRTSPVRRVLAPSDRRACARSQAPLRPWAASAASTSSTSAVRSGASRSSAPARASLRRPRALALSSADPLRNKISA